ncbi:26S proteasome non-ATPase regulatory subunit 13-like B [Vitis vinifera]|uniref:26S proteasome non-ATPase regulatory subunit 13-like B n=1 Tax=Vitis vinifera TaxID=29760 RepID=A0A438E245_VITVI|nr:26S proteasome non-ATPase regulatory subunit 13-like B [Vitis vinifera]
MFAIEPCKIHKDALSVQLALIENDKKLSEKINILCLMELIFSHPLKIALHIIAESMKLSIANVEYFLMKSLLVHLIEGIVDQTDGLDNDVKFAKLPVSDCG